MKKDFRLKISFSAGEYIADASFKARKTLRLLGFKWNAGLNKWTTTDARTATGLRKYADSDAKTQIDRSLITVEKPWPGGSTFYPKGLKPKQFQFVGNEFIVSRNFSYYAADPGLGKTIVMALALNAYVDCPAIVVNQPSLCLNTEAELLKWCITKENNPRSEGMPPRIIKVYDPKERGEVSMAWAQNGVLIVPDSLLNDPLGEHNRLHEAIERMTAMGDALLFVDEAQRFNHMESQRTKALLRLSDLFSQVVLMSGTPLKSDRLMELYPILSKFAPETIDYMSQHEYGMEYCQGYHDGHGYKYPGADKTEILIPKIKEKFMLRVKKADVLPELPPKQSEIVFIGNDLPSNALKFEREAVKAIGSEDFTREQITKSPHLATYRRILGRYKVKPAAAFIKDTLDYGNESILVFAEHVETLSMLAEALKSYRPLVVTPGTTNAGRQALVKCFQAGNSRIFMGNTQKCSLGLTLTRASRVIHVEPSWVPTDSDQATDRAHRIGQVNDVFEQFLCFKNSLDYRVMKRATEKREVIGLL